MSRRRVTSMIRRFGQPFWKKSQQLNGELTPFNGYLRQGHSELLTTDPLAVGDAIHPIGEPLRQFLVTASRPGAWNDEYSIAAIGHHAQLLRYSLEQPRDSFGRAVTQEPTQVYADVPLVVLPSVSDRAQNDQDRTAEATDYIFQTQDIYLIQPKDRLTVSGLNLIVSCIRLAPTGLTEFTATTVQS